MERPTLRALLRQRLCPHMQTTAMRDGDLGEVWRCENCGYTVWTDPPDLADRVEAWISAKTRSPSEAV
jgi:hypothetical protein